MNNVPFKLENIKLKKKILLFSVLVSILFMGCGEKKKTETKVLESKRIESLQAQVDSLKIENDSLSRVSIPNDEESNYWFNPLYDGRNLLRQGIENPGEFIEKSLREKPELIPLKGVLGGTMRFRKIQPLGNQWVIAYYEDGHIEGRAIYKYDLNSLGKLDFKLLDDIKPE